MLAELDPAGAVARDQRELAAVLETADQLGALFHDRDVSRVVDVEYLVEAETAERCDHLAFDVRADRHVKFFAELYADGRCGTDDHMHFGIGERFPDLVGVVTLGERAGRADADALTAVDAGCGRQRQIERACDVGLEAALVCADDVAVLVVFADRYAAAAKDALRIVADEMDRGIVDVRLGGCAVELVRVAAVFLGKRLQFAVAASHAAQAVHAVVRKHQLEGHLAGCAKRGRVRLHFHAFCDLH